MSKPGRFIKLYPQMTQWEWYEDANCVRLFLHLMLTVNSLPGKWKGMDIPAGSRPTSSIQLSRELKMPRTTLGRTLDRLQKTGEVDIRTDSKWTLVTLRNWAKYQSGRLEPDTYSDTKRTPNGHQTDTELDRRERKNTPNGVSISTHTQGLKEKFRADCKAICDADPARLPEGERKAFFDYWTETNEKGKLRFQFEKVFDIGRRMDTWRSNMKAQPEAEKPPGKWNPRR